jgi:hypothetical protein
LGWRIENFGIRETQQEDVTYYGFPQDVKHRKFTNAFWVDFRNHHLILEENMFLERERERERERAGCIKFLKVK